MIVGHQCGQLVRIVLIDAVEKLQDRVDPGDFLVFHTNPSLAPSVSKHVRLSKSWPLCFVVAMAMSSVRAHKQLAALQ
jgi:hypothetical protein